MLNIVFVFQFFLYCRLNIKKISDANPMALALSLKDKIDKLMESVSQKESLIYSIKQCENTFFFNSQRLTIMWILEEQKGTNFRKMYRLGVKINKIIANLG
jgi:hypothetical protein